jgi:threonine/homoserine/homoserine lactone efflux protein
MEGGMCATMRVMPDPSTLLLFAIASATLVAIPGPAVVYIVTRGVAQGRSAGVVSAMGIETGALFHVAAAVAGLSALVASSAAAFAVVKYAGAAYLVLLGIQRLRSRSGVALADLPRDSRWRLFRQGVVVSVLNPKVALFFVAFLPQFVDPDRGAVALQVALLGGLFVAIAAALDCVWAVAAGSAGDRLRRRASARRWLDRISGGTYLGLGVAAALSRR